MLDGGLDELDPRMDLRTLSSSISALRRQRLGDLRNRDARKKRGVKTCKVGLTFFNAKHEAGM